MRFISWLFRCSHGKTGPLLTDKDGDYVICLTCTERVPKSLPGLGIKPPKGYPKLRPMKARRGTKDAALAKSMGVKL
jgi:hypothetical protein